MVIRTLGFCLVFGLSGCVAEEGNGHVVEERRRISDFSRIDCDGPFDVEITQSADPEVRVRIDSNLQRFVETHVHGDTLLIESNVWIVDLPRGPHVIIALPELESLENHGSGDIFATGFDQDKDIQLRLTGSGNLTVEGTFPRVSAALSGSGDMYLSGTTDQAQLALDGSGDLDAVDLIATEADISVDGSGDVRARVDGPVDARTAGSGDIELSGDLERGRFSERGSGRIYVR